MQRRAAEESLTDHGKDNSNGRAHVGDAIRHKPGILGFLRQIGFMGATGYNRGNAKSFVRHLSSVPLEPYHPPPCPRLYHRNGECRKMEAICSFPVASRTRTIANSRSSVNWSVAAFGAAMRTPYNEGAGGVSWGRGRRRISGLYDLSADPRPVSSCWCSAATYWCAAPWPLRGRLGVGYKRRAAGRGRSS